jgi:hypothetical protein
VRINYMRNKVSAITGRIILLLGGIFVTFSLAPWIIPGGVPSGPLEFGGKGLYSINGLEFILGSAIMIVGGLLWKFAPRHIAILASGIVLVVIMSAFAALSSLNWNLTLTGVAVTMNYGSNDRGYFGPIHQMFAINESSQLSQNVTVDEGSSFVVFFSIQELPNATGNDGIASIKMMNPIQDFGFQITSINPPLPISFAPGSIVRIELALRAPYYSTGQTCPPQYCLNGKYASSIFLVLTTTGS